METLNELIVKGAVMKLKSQQVMVMIRDKHKTVVSPLISLVQLMSTVNHLSQCSHLNDLQKIYKH